IVGSSTVLQTKQALHGPGPLHLGDTEPLHLYAGSGDIQGITLFSAKQARILAGNDITDIAFYLQNVDENDVSIVAAGRDIVAYNANASLRAKAQAPGNALNVNELPLAGDIQISGPGTLEVLAGRNLDLGTGASNSDGTASGITSIGNARNPYLPFEGAGVIAGAGIGFANGLANGSLDLETFLDDIVKSEKGAAYLQELAATIPTLKAVTTVQALDQLSEEQRAIVAVQMFYLVLRDAGRSQGDAITGGGYDEGYAAIEALFPNASGKGDINTQARDIRTRSGGNITLFSPVGSLTLATATIGAPLAPPGVVTEAGGNISVFTQNNVDIGISRIFTLRGGNIMIWSSEGDIAAGSSAKTVQSAPPTRVIIDPQTADVKTDLAGLATGGGIGVLDTIAGVTPGNVDLIAPSGTVDAGDAGVRSAGNLNIAAAQVLNASNIQVAGSSSGTPASAPPSAPSLASVVAPTTATQQTTNPAEEEKKRERESRQEETPPSLISVEVIGYGGGSQEEDEEERRRKKAEAVEVSGA
ncbi:MAG: filamentous hemagglutinin family protein, partial [Verrucomicrobiota bacterium]